MGGDTADLNPMFPGRFIERYFTASLGFEVHLLSLSGFASVMIGQQGGCDVVVKSCFGYYTAINLLPRNSLDYYYGLKFYRNLNSEGVARAREGFFFEIDTVAHLGGLIAPRLIKCEKNADIPYMITERIGGGTLKEYLANNPISNAKLQLIHKMWTLLEALHAEGIVHTDLTPDNIVITASGSGAYLIDFNCSCKVGEKLTPRGIYQYYDPEYQNIFTASFYHDVYSMLVIVYEVLTGSIPVYFQPKIIVGENSNAKPLDYDEAQLARIAIDLLQSGRYRDISSHDIRQLFSMQ